MLNRNDPLIGAVQEVMRKNQAERDAVKSVNEKFGVQDRRALPHERQGEWDAAYKKVITEGVVNTAPELEEGKEGDWNKDMKKKQAYVAKKLTPKAKAARDAAAEKIDEEQIDEISSALASRAARVAGEKHDAAREQGLQRQAKAYSAQGTRLARYAHAKKDDEGMSSLKRNYEKKNVSEEEQIDEVLDTPGKRLKYALKSAGSKVKARMTGDTKTADKRTSGLKMAGKKASAAVEKSKKDSVNNEIARHALKTMAHKTGYGALYDKSGLYEEEQIDEKAPPGREDQVKALKGKVGKESAFKIAWASYNKKKGK